VNDIYLPMGLGVALATPFTRRGSDPAGAIDVEALGRLAARTVAGGADFLVALGSTGEAATVRPEERALVVKTVREHAGKAPVAVGVGHNSTAVAAALAAEAAALGADALLVVTPYYNKPQPAGLEAHFRAVAASAPGLPIIAYNVPGRTGLNLAPRDLARLWEIPEVVAVKESSGNLAQIGEISRRLPPGKVLLAGDDALALPAISLGASGLVSVVANVLPAETRELIGHALEGRRTAAIAAQKRLLPLMDALFLETNPVPLKAALAIQGICSALPRLPLVEASESTYRALEGLLAEFSASGATA
jgi:4-hydroxy-tetrahydrodipicolinate synthase